MPTLLAGLPLPEHRVYAARRRGRIVAGVPVGLLKAGRRDGSSRAIPARSIFRPSGKSAAKRFDV